MVVGFARLCGRKVLETSIGEKNMESDSMKSDWVLWISKFLSASVITHGVVRNNE